MASDAILYYAHLDSPSLRREVAELHAQLGTRYDIFVTGYCQSADALARIECVPTVAYSAGDLRSLPYPIKIGRFNPDDYIGNTDLVPMRFFRDHPGYDRYWLIEYDVRFGGEWSGLFSDLAGSEADLLSTTLQTCEENPGWAHWHTLTTGADDIRPNRRVKGFMPFARLSRRLLHACDALYRRGWAGHYEALWPTAALASGLCVEDVGGDSAFTPKERRGRYYFNTPSDWSLFPGTFVYRPCFADRDLSGPGCRFPGLLWHPVKESR